MYQFFVEPAQINVTDKSVIIIGNDVNHIKNVLRMRPGEEISVSNGQDGKEYRCGILTLEEDRIICGLRFVKEDNVELPSRVYLFQGIPKADKMEWIVQKAVELGVCQVIPVAARRCVTKLDEKKAQAKVRRWQAIAQSAAKQSKRSRVPVVRPVMDFASAALYAMECDCRLVPYENECGMQAAAKALGSIRRGERISVMIGPEGGFAPEEIEALRDKMQVISLGRRILRTDTAAAVMLAALMLRIEMMEDQ